MDEKRKAEADRFNSSMVRLGARINLPFFMFFQSFNSSMVRLGDGTNTSLSPAIAAFQFQYGAIRSSIRVFGKMVRLFVSIPVWCD